MVRDGKRMNLKFTPEEQPSNFDLASRGNTGSLTTPDSSQIESLGMEVSSLDSTVAEQLGMTGAEGVVITNIRANSPADQAGLESGMVITQVNRRTIKSLDDFNAAMKQVEPKDGVLLLVRSQEGARFVVIK